MDVKLFASVSFEGGGELIGAELAEIVVPLAAGGTGLLGRGLGALHSLHRGLRRRLAAKRFDVVHSHSGTYPYAVVPLAADGRTSVRLHSLYCPLGARGGVYSRWWDRPILARMLFARLDRVIAVTDNVRQSLERAGVSPSQVESVPMCVDTQRFQPRERTKSLRYFLENGHSLRLLYIGNASKEKGLVPLLHATKRLIDEGVSVSLVAALENQSRVREYAAGHDRAKRVIEELEIGRNVRLLGLVDRIEDLYVESDLLVIPWETSRGPSDYPMVALEAMAMGKCVVSTPVGGCPELLDYGKAGVLAEGFSAEHLASAIRSSLRNPAGRRAVERAAIRKVEGLSLSASARRMISLYERLLGAKRRRD